MPEPLAKPLRARAWACRSDGLPSERAIDLISDRPNRWNVDGEPTIYLSGDPALALVESGRHPDDVAGTTRLVEVDLRIPLALDLRDREVHSAFGLPSDPTWVLHRSTTRAMARTLRRSRTCDALIVPSAGALDQPDRWNAVVFADDRLAVMRMVGRPRTVGRVAVDPAGTEPRGRGSPVVSPPPPP